jgi:very-short-patch-repair endonuclease
VAQSIGLSGRANCASTKPMPKRNSGITLRNRQVSGHKFVRQQPIGRYICDFVCREKLVVIEVDGGQHAESKRDEMRDQYLRQHGYRIMRFWNNDVLSNIEGVLSAIDEGLKDIPEREFG